jgi:hypothetical protein
MSARSTGERDRDAALIVASGWLRDGLPGRGGERRRAEAAFDLDGILRGIRKAEPDSYLQERKEANQPYYRQGDSDAIKIDTWISLFQLDLMFSN